MADGGLDAMLKQMQGTGGLSAMPEPAAGAGTPGYRRPMPSTSSAPSPVPAATFKAPADVAPVTTQNGYAGVLDAFKAVGGMTPDQYGAASTDILKQIQAANAPAIAGIEQNIQKRGAILGQPLQHPAVPKLQALPQAPDTTMKNPLQVFKNSASILGMLGSLFTRKPLVTAMNSAAAAIKGYADGDKDAAERAHRSWKDSLEQAVAQNQAEMDQYNALLQDTQLTMADRTAQLQGLAASNNDQNMLAALRSGEPQMAFQILDGRQKAAQSLAGMLVQAQQFEESQALDRQKMAETERYHAQLTGGVAGGGPLDPETVQMLGTLYLSGDPSALAGLGQGRAGMAARQQVLKWAATQTTGATPDIALSRADYGANKATLKQMQNYISRADTFQSVFLKNIQQVKKYSEAGVGGSVPVINKWIQAGRRATGDPDVAAFDAAIRTAGREYARIMSGPTSNAQLTVSAQATADEMLSPNMNAEQLQSVITVMEQDIQNSIQSAADTVDVIKNNISAGGGQGSGDGVDHDIKEGDVVEQDGHKYKFTNGQYVLQ